MNPYIKKKEGIERNGFAIENKNNKEIVYMVLPLPQSLLNYVLNIGDINENKEKIIYIVL